MKSKKKIWHLISLVILLVILALSSAALSQEALNWSEPENLEALNSKENDFAPSWNKFEKKLYFNSDRDKYSTFYLSHYDNTSGFTSPLLITSNLNKKRNNQSYITFLSANEAVFSSYRLSDRRPYLNLFTCRKKKNEWSETAIINELSGDFFAAQPSISPDGKTMVFSTTLESEKKDTDLWATYLQDDNTWSQPVFISELNTTGNEITPFLLSEDTLFFASNGQGGPGGYDIFYSVKSKGLWQKPYPLSGLNTEYDESDFILIPGGLAIFSSNRPGGKGKLDLWTACLEASQKPTQEYLADFELSIALQTSSIKTHRDIVYRNYYIPFIVRIDNEKTPYLLKNDALVAACNSNYLVDSIYYNMYSLLAREFLASSGKITITIYGTYENSKEIIDTIIEHFTDSYGINRERFIVQNIRSTPAESSYIYFSIDSYQHSSFYKLGKDSVSLLPPVVELNIDARPRKLMRSWELRSNIDNDDQIIFRSGTEVPSRIISDLRQYECNLAYSDSLVFNITGLDSIGRKAKEKIKLPVIHSVSEKAEIIMHGGKEYFSYFILIFDSFFLDKYGIYDEFFEHIRSKYQKSKSIIIFDHTSRLQHDDRYNNDRIKFIPNELKNSLIRKCRIQESDILIDSNNSHRSYGPYSEDLQPYIIEFLIER
jgi:hypothetical protein